MPDKKPRYIQDMTLKEISVLHGQKPAQPDATIRMQKAAPTPDKPRASKQDTSGHSVVAHTSVTQAHQHSVIRRQNGTYALGLGGDPSHTHDITVDGDRVQVAMAEGHTHDVREPMSDLVNKSADNESKVLAALLLDNLVAFEKKTEDSSMNDIEKAKISKAQAEQGLDALAKECQEDNAGMTIEKAMSVALETPRGQELYAAIYARDVQKSAGDTEFDLKCDAAVDRLLKSAIDKWDSLETIERKRTVIVNEFYNGPEFVKLYNECYAPAAVEKAEPELEAVTAGLLSKSEIESDPESALEKLAAQVAWKEGISKKQAMAGFYEPDSIGYPVLLKSDAAHRARSQRAMAGLGG